MTSAKGGTASTIAVVGTGLIGTSVALAAARTGSTVRGYDSDERTLSSAASIASFTPASSISECAHGADLVVVCTPAGAVPAVVAESLAAARGAIVTDVASVKTRLLDEVEKMSGSEGTRFVGGHPMAGSERAGPDGASATLLEGAAWVLTPGARSDRSAIERVERFVTSLGARPIRMDAERHDRLVALVSHLPQLVSTAMMRAAEERARADPQTLELAASGFRDLTRLAESEPGLWTEIFTSNREPLQEAVDFFIRHLQELRELLSAEEVGRLRNALAGGQRAREMLAAKPRIRAGVVLIHVPIPDRPGALAELTAALSGAGVNIEDLAILHSPWGGSGIAHVTVRSDAAEPAVQALADAHFPAELLQ
jgi:prephenate dehydrogenase